MALSPTEVRRALMMVTATATAQTDRLLGSLSGSSAQIRDGLLEGAPQIVGYYSQGSSALAADWYDDLREEAAVPHRFASEPVVNLREEALRGAVGYAAAPLFQTTPDLEAVRLRLLPAVQQETARPFRDTITTSTRRDPAAVGWRRVTSSGGCKFCRMLADKGAIFKESTARFASHENCNCGAQPVFAGQGGDEASVMQYMASQKRRTAKDKARLREYLDANY